jgi:hypothetical protein
MSIAKHTGITTVWIEMRFTGLIHTNKKKDQILSANKSKKGDSHIGAKFSR